MNNNINLNLYKTFYEVANSGSISEAAKKTFTSQPAISKAIKKLEDELETQLFYRDLTGIKLTNKGKELYFYVEQAYNSFLMAERAMIETENLQRGSLSIGVPSQIGTFYIFDKIEQFHLEHPNIKITIISKPTNQLINLLETHVIDFIIDTSPISYDCEDIIIKPLKKVKNCFVAKEGSKFLPSIKTKSLKSLSDIPLVLPTCGTSNRKELDSLFDKFNIEINNSIDIHTSEMIVGAINRDLGIGYLIYDLVAKDIEEGKYELIQLNESLPEITINLVYIEKYLTVAPKRFINTFFGLKI